MMLADKLVQRQFLVDRVITMATDGDRQPQAGENREHEARRDAGGG